ncbi:hypothetical protein HPP92_011564 [Vanilla planifolia]|uniref:Uncharacterized protein n=1 Tax=Vanilla planifolia TaxID=51239 RepID=A0A835R8P7_VANPL|nr:hypothetical protein HPP92_011855 [Vanilla planifolia]KAG0483480.1 hypothetical protein HPP92_011564 [Vanilla planifolia]
MVAHRVFTPPFLGFRSLECIFGVFRLRRFSVDCRFAGPLLVAKEQARCQVRGEWCERKDKHMENDRHRLRIGVGTDS